MPIFGGASKRAPNDHQRRGSNNVPPRENEVLPPLPPPPSHSHWSRAPPSHSVVPPRRELVFHCQLAHGSATKDIKDFSNVKALYGRIGEAFGISMSEIVFCTLNTHKADMSRLLGGQIGLEDFIFVHIRGHTKEVTLRKSEAALGLTITDNGAGVAFVKRLREGSIAEKHPEVIIGDMIESINGRRMVGCRHYEVAKLLKDIPQYTDITLRLTDTKKAFDAIAPRGASSKVGVATVPVLDGDTDKLEEIVGEGRATLRLKKNGQAVVEQVKPWENKAALRVDDLLETFLGIRDMELAQTMVDLGKDKSDLEHFSVAMDEHLGEFEFPSDFVADVWGAILRAKATLNSS